MLRQAVCYIALSDIYSPRFLATMPDYVDTLQVCKMCMLKVERKQVTPLRILIPAFVPINLHILID